MRRARAVLLLLAGLAAVHWRALRGWVIADRDAARIFFPDSAFLERCLRGGEFPLWQPYAFLGSPFAASLQAQLFYPPRVLAVLLFGPYWSLTLLHVFHAGIAAAGAYRLARALGRSAEAGALCAVAFGLSPVLADLGTTPNLVHAAAWAPWVVLAARRRWTLGLAGFLALALLAGSPEMVLWELGLIALVGVRRRTWGRVLGAVAWGGALAMAALLPAAEAALASARGTARVDPLDWSASPRQLLAMAWPLADSPRGPYWGPDQWLLIQVFAGTVVVALAVVGARRSRRALPFAIGAVVFGLLALGRAFPPAAWVLSTPPLNVFRYPAKYLVGVLFCLAVLAAYGVDAVAAGRRAARRRRETRNRMSSSGASSLQRAWRPIARCCGFLAGSASLRALRAPRRTETRNRTRASAAPRLWWAWSTFARCCGFLAVGALLAGATAPTGLGIGLPWVALALGAGAAATFIPRTARGIRRALLATSVLELAIFHALQVGHGWAPASEISRPSSFASALDARAYRISVPIGRRADAANATVELSRQPSEALLASRQMFVPNRFTEDEVRALEGYGAPEPARIFEFQLSGQRAVADLAGVRTFLRSTPPFPNLRAVAALPGGLTAYQSETAFPRAWVASRGTVASDHEVLDALTRGSSPFRDEVLLADGPPLHASACPGASARVVAETCRSIDLEATACPEGGFLVLSDAFDPGWRAQVDGQPATLLRADLALRAVRLTGGAHQVRMTYSPRTVWLGLAVSAAALAALATAKARRLYRLAGMHLPPPSPPIRGFLLRVLARLTAIGPLRRLILIKLRRDTGISRLRELDR